MNTSYPSISSTAGSATGNSSDIIDALKPYVEHSIRRNVSGGTRFLELASGTGEHLRAYAREWEQVEWVGSERDVSSVASLSSPDLQTFPANAVSPVKLDVLEPSQWDQLEAFLSREEGVNEDIQTSHLGSGTGSSENHSRPGVIDGIIINNLLHCAPHPETSHAVFKHASRLIRQESPRRGQREEEEEVIGWISVYGAFKRDDGEFASEGDKKFDERFKGLHERFGLRTVASIKEVAREYGWNIREIKEMRMGNRMIFFERRADDSTA